MVRHLSPLSFEVTLSSEDDDDSAAAESEKKNFKSYLNSKSFYLCIYCRTHLADHDELASRTFHGSHGRANLFNTVVNVVCGPSVQRDLMTGTHVVCDVYCKKCNQILGWRYDKAYPKSQKYKEGKYVIELAHVIRENRHLDMDNSDIFFGNKASSISSGSAVSSSNSSPQGSYGGVKYEVSPNMSNGLAANRNSSNGSGDNSNKDYSSSLRSNYSDSMTTNNSPDQAQRNERLSSVSSSRSSSKPIEHRKGSLCLSEGGNGNDGSVAGSPYDEDLLFAFYDDWCASKPSQANNMSSTHFNRKRRSLYSESTRYDWKMQDNPNSDATTEAKTSTS